ncbi:MAG: SIR2 family protein [Candidatus Margulisiibacteriota bacterium]
MNYELDYWLDHIANEKAVLFIGAGISKIAGCYDWNTIIEKLNNHDVMKEAFPKQIVLKSILNEEWMEVCRGKFDDKERIDDFWGILSSSLYPDDKLYSEKYVPLVMNLKKVKPFPKIITTNIDDCLERTKQFDPGKVLYEECNYVMNKFVSGVICHIHGYCLNLKAALWFKSQYIRLYEQSEFSKYIKEIISNYSVLFIGYGFRDKELLNLFGATKSKGSDIKHFALIPSHEYTDENEAVYKDLYNITLIKYGETDRFIPEISQWIDSRFVESSIISGTIGGELANV